MKAIVTGGAGFIGGAIVKRLIADGWKVLVIDNFFDGRIRQFSNASAAYPILVQDIGELFLPDNRQITHNSIGITDDFLDADWIFHLAGHYANVRSLMEPVLNIQTNMIGTMVMLRFAKEYGIKKFMYASSSGVYGAMDAVAYAENSQPRPSTPYECTKYAAELLSIGWGEIYGISVLAPRFFNVYGPGDLPGPFRAVIPNFIQSALQNRKLCVTGKFASRDFTYIDDVIEGVMAGVQRIEQMPAGANLVYNIATGRETLISELAGMVVKTFESQSEVEVTDKRIWDNAERRVGDVHKYRALFPKAADGMRYVDEGLKAAAEWYREVCA